uniref:DUF4440 domain-containing protein n=1 Tax=Plectus sambesii TaxID=2011161 RepID=A0A914VTV3_9BILA
MSGLEQEIKNRQVELAKPFNAGNAAGVAEFYDPDCTMISASGKLVKGREGVEEVYQEYLDGGVMNSKNTTEEVNGSSDWAFERGNYQMEIDRGTVGGGYLLVWKKVNGTWLIHNECFTAPSPASG